MDDPPIITAVAPGHVTVTGGSGSADVTVYAGSMPQGTVIWSVPANGSGVTKILPAVPSATGVADVFALQGDGTVQAVTSSGAVAWTANVGSGTPIPDFQGGLVVADGPSKTIQRFDGLTGQPYPAYSFATGQQANVLVHTDGTIFAVDGSSIVGIDPSTGGTKFSIALEQGIDTTIGDGCLEHNPTALVDPARVGNGIIAGDGYAYVPYSYFHESHVGYDCYSESNGTTYLSLLRIDTAGNGASIPLGSWNRSGDCSGFTYAGEPTNVYVITNADQGAMVTWQLDSGSNGSAGQSNQTTYYIATTSGGSVISQGTMDKLVQPVLQAQDGSFYGSFLANGGTGSGIVKFDQYGKMQWSVPGDSPQVATADNGVVGASGITYDGNGNATDQNPLPIFAWTENAYQTDPGQAQQVAYTPPDAATSFWPGGEARSHPGANASGTPTAYQPIVQTSYVRIFAPWPVFGPDPFVLCVIDCFLGDNRTFTTTIDKGVVTARINSSVKLRFPGMGYSRTEANDPDHLYSDLTTARFRPFLNKGKSHPKIAITRPPADDILDLQLSGADPLVPLAPNIVNTLSITDESTTEKVCYSGALSGDAFPNTEVFVVNSKGQATTLLNFATTHDRNAGPWTLLSPTVVPMGTFSNICVPK